MPRLLIHVEGQTEEEFVNNVLADHLRASGYARVGARLIGNARLRENRGGIRSWASVKKDILNHLKEDTGCIATTMIDYYGMPKTGEGAWPGRADARGKNSTDKARWVEEALASDIDAAPRFVPFVVMHEFEGLLFSDCVAFAKGIASPDLAERFQSVRERFPTPEDINDSPESAPSKQIADIVIGYQKPFHGILAALEIGLTAIRKQCPHFDEWITKSEKTARDSA